MGFPSTLNLSVMLFVGPFVEVPEIRPSLAVVQSLSVEAGISVQVAKALGRHSIMLDRQGLGAMDALQLVARTMSAKLERTGSREYRLEPSVEVRERLREKIESSRQAWLTDQLKVWERRSRTALRSSTQAEAIRRWIDQTAEAVESGRLKPAEAAPEGLAALLPSADLLLDAVRSVGVSTVAKGPTGSFKVFETKPVGGATLLRISPKALEALEDSQVRLASELSASQLRMSQIPGFEPDTLFGGDTRSTTQLRLEVRLLENCVELILEGFDDGGSRTLLTGMVAGPDVSYSQPSSVQKSVAASVKSEGLVLSAEQSRAFQAWSATSANQEVWFAKPSSREPLNDLIARPLSATLPFGKTPMAVDIPDGLVRTVSRAVHGNRLAVKWLKDYFQKYELFSSEMSGPGVALRWHDPTHAESTWADRRQLEQFSSKVFQTRGPTIRDTGKLLALGVNPSPLAIGWYQMGRVSTPVVPTNDFIPIPIYRFLGQITDDAWGRLLRGDTLSVGRESLQTPLQELLQQPLADRLVSFRPLPDQWKHPLELFDQMPLDATTIRVTTKRQPLEFVTTGGPATVVGPAMEFFGDPITFTFIRAKKEFVAQDSRESFDERMSSYWFQPGEETDYEIRLELPHQVSLVGVYQSPQVLSGSPVRYRDLPESRRAEMFRRAWEAGLKTAKAIYGVYDNESEVVLNRRSFRATPRIPPMPGRATDFWLGPQPPRWGRWPTSMTDSL